MCMYSCIFYNLYWYASQLIFFQWLSMCLKFLILFFTYLLTFLSECTEVSDCPNAGKDFQCNFNFCECESGFYFDGFSCADGKWFVHLSGLLHKIKRGFKMKNISFDKFLHFSAKTCLQYLNFSSFEKVSPFS